MDQMLKVRSALHHPHSRLAALAALLVLASACGGPRTPVSVGVKEFPTDVLLGTKAGNLTPLRPAPINTNPVFVYPRRPVIPPFNPPVIPPVACPKADPLSAPKLEAFNRATLLPVEASYPFRTTGSVMVVGGVSEALPEEATITIQNVERVDKDAYTFEVLDELDGNKTLSRYQVVQTDPLDGTQKGLSGIFLTETVVAGGDDKPTTYTWTPKITLARFPLEVGDRWDVASTAQDGSTITFSAMIGEEEADNKDPGIDPQIINHKVRVDACGEFLDAWNIQIGTPDATGEPSGNFVGPKAQAGNVAADTFGFLDGYAIAPQFGGIIVKYDKMATGVSDGKPFTSERTSTINVVPQVPQP